MGGGSGRHEDRAPTCPVIEDVTVSVAVMVWLPAVLSVAENVATPLVKVAVRRQYSRSVAAGEVQPCRYSRCR